MKGFKLFFIVLVLLVGFNVANGQSISVSGGGTWTLGSGESTHAFRFWISYTWNGLQTASLHYKVDGGSSVPSNYITDGSNNPSYVDIPLGEGSHSIEFIWYGYNWGNLTWSVADTETKTSTVNFKVYVTNNFGSGNVSIDGDASKISGSFKTVMSGNSINIGAIEQNDGTYNRVWSTSGSLPSKWIKKKADGSQFDYSTAQSTSYSVASDDNATTLETGLRKVCGLTFQAYSGMSINGSSRTSPFTENVVEQDPIPASCSNYSASGVDFVFNGWKSGGTSYYSSVSSSSHYICSTIPG